MSMKKDIKPFINIGPGYTIKKYLDARGWTQEDLSQLTDISAKQLSLIINNKSRITVETARLLAKAFETSPEFWINLDTRYRLNMDEDNQKEKATRRKAKIRKYMPVSEIINKGWFVCEKNADGYEDLYQKIWQVDVDDVSMYERPERRYCARQNRKHEEYTVFYTMTWHQIARQLASSVDVAPYDDNRVMKIIDRFTEYTVHANGITKVLDDLKKAGIKFFTLSHLSKTYLDGACFWDNENPVVVYTARYDRIDNFWFTLAHELAHVILHLPGKKNQCFLDDLSEENTDDRKEKEADEKAEEILHVQEIVNLSTPYLKYFSEAKLQSIAGKLGIEESVILGVLQHKGLVEYRKLNKFKRTVSDLLPKKVIKG